MSDPPPKEFAFDFDESLQRLVSEHVAGVMKSPYKLQDALNVVWTLLSVSAHVWRLLGDEVILPSGKTWFTDASFNEITRQAIEAQRQSDVPNTKS